MWTTLACFKRYQHVPQRIVVAVLTFLAVTNHIWTSNCFSLMLTQMVMPSASNDSVSQNSCPANVLKRDVNVTRIIDDDQHNGVKFHWSQDVQGFMLSAFFAGFVIMNIPGGQLCDRVGAKPLVVAALIISATLTLATPTIALFGGAYALIVVRFVIGLSQGGLFPAVNALLSSWAPMHERGRMASFIYCGSPVGSLTGNLLTGILMQYFEWHSVFYVIGSAGWVIAFSYIILATSYPSTNPFISEREKDYLTKEIGQLERDQNLLATPWKSILTSKAVIALVVVAIIGEFGNFILWVFQPIYLSEVVHADIQQISFYTSIPWVLYIFTSMGCGSISDWIITKGYLDISSTRKLFFIISCLIDGTSALGASYAGCNAHLVGQMFAVSIAMQGLLTSSLYVIPTDLSPNYAGTISAMMYSIACITSIFSPIIIGYLAPNSLLNEWRTIFWISLFAQVSRVLIFTLWGSAKVQPWNIPDLPVHRDSQSQIDSQSNDINNKL